MAALSKHYAEIVKQLTCTELFHPGRHCGQYAAENFGKIFQLCAKFYTPMVLAQYARSANTLDANTVKEFFQTLLQLTFSTYMGSAVGQSLSCVFYQTVGFPHPLFLVFLPGLIGNTWGFIAPAKVYGIITNGLWMMIFEAFYHLDNVFPLSIINRSTAFRTLMFMTMSQFILNSKRIQKSDVFWFVKPSATVSFSEADKIPEPRRSTIMDAIVPTQQHICQHPTSCDEHIYRGAVMNFKIGLGIEVVRVLLGNVGLLQRQPLQIFQKLLDMNTGLIVFLVGYTTVYRTTICALNRRQQRCSDRSESLSGFLAGSAYYCYPNFTILAHATISTIKLMWSRYVALNGAAATAAAAVDGNRSNADAAVLQLRRLINYLPLGKFFYVLSVGVVFHMRTFYPWMCPKLLMNAVQYTSGMNADQSMLRFTNYLLGFQQPAKVVAAATMRTH